MSSLLLVVLAVNSLIHLISSYDKNLWAFVISTSHTYENYRHSVNSLMMYNFLKKNGIPEERIIVGLSEYHACSPKNFYPGKIYLTEKSHILESCQQDTNIDFKEADFHNFQILDILRGRSSNLINNFRKLKTDKNSRIVIIITSHGGENFIKVRGRSVILSDELNRALTEMHIKERYKEILFILDTCEGYTLFDSVNVPNVFFVSSSVRDQKASSYSYDDNLMTPTADKFHFILHELMETGYRTGNFKSKIEDIFQSIKNRKQFLGSDVTTLNRINREIIFEEFFGNHLLPAHLNENVSQSLRDESTSSENPLLLNTLFIKEKLAIDKDILNIKQYTEQQYLLKQPKEKTNNDIEKVVIKIILLLFILNIVYVLLNSRK